MIRHALVFFLRVVDADNSGEISLDDPRSESADGASLFLKAPSGNLTMKL